MLRKKGLWVFTFVSVFGFALILSFLSSTSALNASIGVLDRDGGTLAGRVIEEAGRFGAVTPLETDETNEALLQGQDVVLVIPDGFSEALLNGETPRPRRHRR